MYIVLTTVNGIILNNRNIHAFLVRGLSWAFHTRFRGYKICIRRELKCIVLVGFISITN